MRNREMYRCRDREDRGRNRRTDTGRDRRGIGEEIERGQKEF